MSFSTRKLSLDIALTFGRQFLAGLLKLGIILLIARILGPEGSGSWSVAQLLPTTLGQMLNLGLVSANVYFVASGQFDIQQVWGASRDLAFVMALAGSLLGVAIVTFAGEAAFPGVNAELLLLAIGLFPLTLLSGLVSGLFQARQDFRRYNILALTEPVISLALIGMVSVTTGLTLTSAMLITMAGYASTLMLGLFFLSRDVRLWGPARNRMDYLRPALRYGVIAHLSNLVTFLNYRLDIYLVNLFLGPAATGIYTVAVRLAEQVWLVSLAVSTVIFPRLSSLQTQTADRDRLTMAVARATLWASTGAGLGLLLIGELLIGVLFGAEFELATGLLALLLPGIVLLACARVLANDLAAGGKVTVNFYISVVLLASNVLATLLLLPPLGLAGAAIATSIAYGLSCYAQLTVHSRISSRKWLEALLPQPEDLERLSALRTRLAARISSFIVWLKQT